MSNSQWTPELKEKVIEMYQAASPTPENSTEIVKEIAEELELTANGVRLVLIQAEVYVKKDTSAGAATKTATGTKTASGTGTKRVSKEDSIKALKDKIEAAGKTVDDEILDKLTGKAAVYLASLF
jgi:transposase-like protein